MIEKLKEHCVYFIPCGSRITCNPPPQDTDRDHIVLVKDGQWDGFVNQLFADGWIQGGSSIPNELNTLLPSEIFNSFTLGIENIIATQSPEFFRRFLAATSVSKRLNLLNKEDRIALFQAVLYANADMVDEVIQVFTVPEL